MHVMKFSILIIDDEQNARTALKILIEKYFLTEIHPLVFARSFEEAEVKFKTTLYDIVFLDINLKGTSGFNLLPLIGKATKIVFVTAYSEYLLKALRNKAFDYLVKPVREEDLRDCLLRLQNDFIQAVQVALLQVRQKGLITTLRCSNILYVEGDGPYSTIYLDTEIYTIARTIKSLMADLGIGFIRIHKTYVVNRSYVKGFNKDKIILLNEKCLPVSRSGFRNLSLR